MFNDEQDRLAQEEGIVNRHYWGNSKGDALSFDGQHEVDQKAQGVQPTHLAPFINHADEGSPKENVQGVILRVSFLAGCFILVKYLIKMPTTRTPFSSAPRAALVYVTIKKVEKGDFLRCAYKPKSKGVLTPEDRRDEAGMPYAM